MIVHCPCCRFNQRQLNQRSIPTFKHTPIYDNQPQKRIMSPHYNPTYYSSAMDFTGYCADNPCSKEDMHSTCLQKQKNKLEQINQKPLKKSQKLQDKHKNDEKIKIKNDGGKVNSEGKQQVPKAVVTYSYQPQYCQYPTCQQHYCQNHMRKPLWFDNEKRKIFEQAIDCYCHGISKQRKYLELTSDPVFSPSYNQSLSKSGSDYKRRNPTQGQKIDQIDHKYGGCTQQNNECCKCNQHQLNYNSPRAQPNKLNSQEVDKIVKSAAHSAKKPSKPKTARKERQGNTPIRSAHQEIYKKRCQACREKVVRSNEPPTFTILRKQAIPN